MEVTIDQLKEALAKCRNTIEEPFPLICYVLQKEIKQRESVGAKRKYDGDAKERNKQAVARHREKKKLAEAMGKDALTKSNKAVLRAESKRRTALEEPIDLRVKKKKKPKWRKSEKLRHADSLI